MAIEKERLTELIEEGATVYGIDNQYQPVQEIDLEEVLPLKRSNAVLFRQNQEDVVIHLEDLYENKADAEWELEFGNVEKRIKFVKPKPFNELDKGSIFLYKNHDFEMKLNIYQCKENGGWLDVDYKDEFIYGSTFNEENYTEACRLIKKLFMEEE